MPEFVGPRSLVSFDDRDDDGRVEDPGVTPRIPGSVLCRSVIGRDRELDSLRTLLDMAAGGRGRTVFILGDAGIGKSRLAQSTVSEAQRRGLAVLRGRAVQGGPAVPYRPLTEALCSAVRATGAPEASELSPFRATLGSLIPDWQDTQRGRVDVSVVALAEAMLRFLVVAAADRGCLLVLEDLHWADPETLTITEYIADNIASERILCLGMVRTEDASPALDLARRLAARRVGELMELSRLPDGHVAEMIRSCLGTSSVPDQVLALVDRAGGVPFLVEELLATAVTSGSLREEAGTWALSTSALQVIPVTVAESVRRRLVGLGEQARRVILAAAILGRRFDWGLLPATTSLDEQTILAALRAAVDAHVVSIDPDGPAFRFRHALTRDAALEALLPPERAAVSRRALEAIEGADPGVPDEWCELAAELATAAADRQRAGAFLLQAGRRALRAGALASAEATLERARVVAPTDGPVVADAEECLLEVLSHAGKYDQAVTIGESLQGRLGDDLPAVRRRAQVHLQLARAAAWASRWEQAHSRLEQAGSYADVVADEVLRARVDALAALTALGEDKPELAASVARKALTAAERLQLPDVCCEALEVLGRHARQHDLDAAEASFRRAYLIAEERGLTVWRIRALHELGTIDLLRSGEVARLEQARTLAMDVGALATAAVLNVQICAALVSRDDPEPALAAARDAASVARRFGLHQTFAAARAFESNVHARKHRRRATEDCIREALTHSRDTSIAVIAACSRTHLAFLEEDRVEALRHLDDPVVRTSGPVPGWRALLRALDPDADAPAAQVRAGSEPVHFLARAYLRYAEAVVLGRARQGVEAGARVAAGDRLLEGFGWYRHYGRRLVAEAAIADDWGDPVSWLREAQAFFQGRYEQAIASACRSLLRRAGAPVPRRRGLPDVPTELRARGVTTRELEVLRLLADGLSNKEIAARLYLSPRTVERHVANLTAKAGVARRSQLVAFAARAAAAERAPR